LQAFSGKYFKNSPNSSFTERNLNIFTVKHRFLNPLINVQHLSRYFGEIKAVDDLSFTVPHGVVYGFLGQNGAGKSTTIRMLLTLVQPGSGSIEIFGMNLEKHRRDILRQTGAMIERPDLYKYLTARENMRIFSALSGIKLSSKQLMDQLERVGLADRAESKVKTFSQGMKQRLGIAIALVHDPKLVILDEPTNGLDPQGIADIRKLVMHLSKDLGKTVFVSSHLLNEIELVADSVLIINKGKKVAEGNKDELLNPAKTQVELISQNITESVNALRQTKWSSHIIESSNGAILLEMDKALIPEFNRTLVEKDIRVISLRPKHSLEDFFLSLTAH
jgi:ABC-type multidrug transport system ATPase subunit